MQIETQEKNSPFEPNNSDSFVNDVVSFMMEHDWYESDVEEFIRLFPTDFGNQIKNRWDELMEEREIESYIEWQAEIRMGK